MNYRMALLAIGLIGGGIFSCVAPDPGELSFSERKAQPGVDPASSSGASGSSTSSSSSSSSSSSGNPPPDGGSTSGGVVTAFAGAKAYDTAGAANGTSNNGAHGANQNPAGRACLDSGCHGPGGTVKWGIAGTIVNAGNPVKKAEVRLVDGTGKELALIYTDDNGNFWADTIVDGVPLGAKVGVRDATNTQLMSGSVAGADANCNRAGCHVTGSTTGPIHLP